MYLSGSAIAAIVLASAGVLHVLDRRIRGLEQQRNVMLSALVVLGYGEYSACRAKTLKHLKRRYRLWPAEKDEPSLASVLISVGPDRFCLACGAVCATDFLACERSECVEYVRANGGFLQDILGHATLNMTRKYSHLAPDHLRSEIAKTEKRAERTEPRDLTLEAAPSQNMNRTQGPTLVS